MKKQIPTQTNVVNQLEEAVRTIQNGAVTAIVQDGRVLQYEKVEKVRLDLPAKALDEIDDQGILLRRSKIAEALNNLMFGQVVFMIKEGKIIQIDRTEKQRLKALQNMYGDGI